MHLKVVYKPHTLDFRFEAGTSRGILHNRTVYFLKIFDVENPAIFGLGECGPLAGLSIDDIPDFETQLQRICQAFNRADLEVFSWNLDLIIDQYIPKKFPSIQFGFETALHDLLNGGRRMIFDNDFSQGTRSLTINGLIWMGKPEAMLAQVEEKLLAGFKTLKMKIGAIAFEEECEILANIRSRFSAHEITLRVDANGAFSVAEASQKLQKLSEYQLHSIEQPIKPKQTEALTTLCRESPVAVALDEELIGVSDYMAKMKLLKTLRPPYIILKPMLLGGFRACKEWIEIANRFGIDWWITSALESNIGLNAIAQFTANFTNTLPQGLGTGQLYHNNIASPLEISGGQLHYLAERNWDLGLFDDLNDE